MMVDMASGLVNSQDQDRIWIELIEMNYVVFFNESCILLISWTFFGLGF